MPGLSVLRSGNDSERFEAVLDGLLYLDDYGRETLYTDATTSVGWSGYPEYPVRTFETDAYHLMLEGHLYATDHVERAVRRVADRIFAGDSEAVERWLLDRDAEFVLLAVEKASGDVAVLNDVLGRLPLYQATVDGDPALSRELGFFVDAADPGMDQLGIAELLLFGYPLGDRTLYEGVRQVEPGSLVRFTDDGPSVERVHQYRFERTPNGAKSVTENAERLAELLRAACRHRATGGTNVVSLSGGLDSRAVAAGFAAEEVPFVTATFDRGGRDADEAAVAEEVADVLGADWEHVDVGPATGTTLQTLLATKRGLNYLGMGFILEFFETLRARHGAGATYVTGDGGDKIFPSYRGKRFDDTSEVIDYLLADASRLDIDTVTDLVDPDAGAIRAEIRGRLESYPGEDPTENYERFLFRERGANWLFHGEDRNRYYFWSVAPFWSWPMVEYAMGVPHDQKKRERLYAATIEALSPDVAEVEYANFGAPITSMEYTVKRFSYDALGHYPAVRDAVVGLVQRGTVDEYPPNVARVLARQRRVGAVGEVLSERAIEALATDRTACDRTAAYNLLTVTSAIERREGESTLAAFAGDEFE
jgi:asparagine synthase (glutamine-hydrolysing)